MARPARVSPDRILAAAAVEFAARGYAGARVDQHRPPRPRQQGHALLPLPQQAGLVPGAAARHASAAPARACRSSRRAAAPPADQLDRAIAAIAGFVRRASVLRRHHAARNRRERRAPRCATPSPRWRPFRARSAASSSAASTKARSGRSIPSPPISACWRRWSVYLAGAPIRRRLSARHLVGGPPLTDDAFVQYVQDTMRRALGHDCHGSTRRDDDEVVLESSCAELVVCLLVAVAASACGDQPPADRVRVSGQVEATEVQVACAGRRPAARAHAGRRRPRRGRRRSSRGSTRPTPSWRSRARAPSAIRPTPSSACCRAGARVEDIRQAEAQLATAAVRRAGRRCRGRGRRSRRRPLRSAARVEGGHRRSSATMRWRGATWRGRGRAAARIASAPRARAWPALRAGARPEEIDAARARVAAADAQIATLQKAITDAVVTTPVAGIVTERLRRRRRAGPAARRPF